MTDEALVEADRLEEAGRWEEAAVLRLTWDDCAAWYEVSTAGVWAEIRGGAHGLRVHLDDTAGRSPYWFWGPGGWTWTRRAYPPVTVCRWRRPAAHCPPEVRRAVEEAVRQVLERRFGGRR